MLFDTTSRWRISAIWRDSPTICALDIGHSPICTGADLCACVSTLAALPSRAPAINDAERVPTVYVSKNKVLSSEYRGARGPGKIDRINHPPGKNFRPRGGLARFR